MKDVYLEDIECYIEYLKEHNKLTDILEKKWNVCWRQEQMFLLLVLLSLIMMVAVAVLKLSDLTHWLAIGLVLVACVFHGVSVRDTSRARKRIQKHIQSYYDIYLRGKEAKNV